MINLNDLIDRIEKTLSHKEKHFFTKKYNNTFLERVLYVLQYTNNKHFLNLDLNELEEYFDIMNYLVLMDMKIGNNNYYIINTMINFNKDEINLVLNCNKDQLYNYICGYKLLKDNDHITSLREMEKYYLEKRSYYLKLISNKKFNSINDMINELGNSNFKEIYFYFVYGLTSEQVNYITNTFSKYLDSLKNDIDNIDRSTYNTLLNIINISSNNFSSISFDHLKQSLIKIDSNKTSFYQLTSKFKRMYMNSYNKHFTKISDCQYVKLFTNIDVYEVPDNFFMALHSMEKSQSYSDSLDDFEEYSFNYLDNFKSAISTSVVGPTNTGLLLSSFYLGFDSFFSDSLETLAPFDAFTSNRSISLFHDYKGLSSNNYFVPPSKMEDETRYGYNEMFNYTKKKPSYIVYMGGIDNLSRNSTIKIIALKLNVPIIVLDIYKVHQKEILKIRKMEDTLFNENKVSLISEIICKYMNLVSGSIVSSNDFDPMKPNYLGIKELNNFLIRFNAVIDNIDDNLLKREYLLELKKAYDMEYLKYSKAINIKQYQRLLSTFVLNDSTYVDMRKYLIDKFNEIRLNTCTNKSK